MISYKQSTSFKCLKALSVITGLDLKHLSKLIEEGQAIGDPFRRAHLAIVIAYDELQENIRDSYTEGGPTK